MQCLGIDVGSTTIKGAVLDLDLGTVAATATRPFPPCLPGLPSGWYEVSPQAILAETVQVLEQLRKAAPRAASVWWSGQMGGVILVNAAGEPLTNYLSWRDQRTLGRGPDGATWLDSLRQRWSGDLLPSLGNELQPGSTTSLLDWLARRGTLPAGAWPATVADFVIGRLCGSRPRMHATQAIGLLDLRTRQWHRAAWDALELGDVRLPELSHGTEAVGFWPVEGRRLPVHGAYGDQPCALRGARLQRGELSLNVSTGSQVSCRVAEFTPGRYQTRCFFDGDWLQTITHLPAGRSLNVLIDLLTELARAEGLTLQHTWDYIARQASAVESNDLEIDLAFFAGPLGTTGSVRHITTENLTVGRLFHAAFQAMARNYAHCAEWLNPPRPWSAVVLSGGLTQSLPVLRTLIQERFPAPLRETPGEETLRGLGELARTFHAAPSASERP